MEITKDEYGRPCVAAGNANEELSATKILGQDDDQKVIHTLGHQVRNFMYDALTIDKPERQKALFELCEDICGAAQTYIRNTREE